MTLDEFYACFAQWEQEMHRCQQAQKDLERAVYQPSTPPEEALYFLAYGELLALLHHLLRHRHFLEFFHQHLPRPLLPTLVETRRPADPAAPPSTLVGDYFQAWRQELIRRQEDLGTPAPRFSLTPRGQALVDALRKEAPPHDLG